MEFNFKQWIDSDSKKATKKEYWTMEAQAMEWATEELSKRFSSPEDDEFLMVVGLALRQTRERYLKQAEG